MSAHSISQRTAPTPASSSSSEKSQEQSSPAQAIEAKLSGTADLEKIHESRTDDQSLSVTPDVASLATQLDNATTQHRVRVRAHLSNGDGPQNSSLSQFVAGNKDRAQLFADKGKPATGTKTQSVASGPTVSQSIGTNTQTTTTATTTRTLTAAEADLNRIHDDARRSSPGAGKPQKRVAFTGNTSSLSYNVNNAPASQSVAARPSRSTHGSVKTNQTQQQTGSPAQLKLTLAGLESALGNELTQPVKSGKDGAMQQSQIAALKLTAGALKAVSAGDNESAWIGMSKLAQLMQEDMPMEFQDMGGDFNPLEQHVLKLREDARESVVLAFQKLKSDGPAAPGVREKCLTALYSLAAELQKRV